MMASATTDAAKQTRAMNRISNADGRRSAIYRRTPPAKHVTQIRWIAPRLEASPRRAPAAPDMRPAMPMSTMSFHGTG